MAGKIVNRKANGEVFREWLSVTAITNEQNATHYVAIFSDLSHSDSVIGEGEGDRLENQFSKKQQERRRGLHVRTRIETCGQSFDDS